MTGYRLVCQRQPERFVWADSAQRQTGYALPTAFKAYKNQV
jgi:hypothetical protein